MQMVFYVFLTILCKLALKLLQQIHYVSKNAPALATVVLASTDQFR